MLYVDDWDRIKERHLAWWQGEIVDRMAVMITAPRDGVPPFEIPPDVDPDRFWTDADLIVELAE